MKSFPEAPILLEPCPSLRSPQLSQQCLVMLEPSLGLSSLMAFNLGVYPSCASNSFCCPPDQPLAGAPAFEQGTELDSPFQANVHFPHGILHPRAVTTHAKSMKSIYRAYSSCSRPTYQFCRIMHGPLVIQRALSSVPPSYEISIGQLWLTKPSVTAKLYRNACPSLPHQLPKMRLPMNCVHVSKVNNKTPIHFISYS